MELTGKVGGKIRGNLYELDYPRHFQHVAAEAVQADTIILHYEKGDREQPASLYFDGRPDPKLGAFLRYEAKANEPENLREVLRQEQKGREQLAPGDFKAHVTALHDRLIRDEAQRIVAGMKELSTPNSPNKTHFMVELSSAFSFLIFAVAFACANIPCNFNASSSNLSAASLTASICLIIPVSSIVTSAKIFTVSPPVLACPAASPAI